MVKLYDSGVYLMNGKTLVQEKDAERSFNMEAAYLLNGKSTGTGEFAKEEKDIIRAGSLINYNRMLKK